MTPHRIGAVTAFSQRDPRWGRDPLGTSAFTLERAGCLVTAVASMLADFGVAIPDPDGHVDKADPGRLNVWLRDHNGYKDGCLFRFYGVAGLGADLMELVRPPKRPLMGRILDAFDDGCAIIAEVARNAVSTHWVRLCGGVVDCGFTWYIMDPWQLPGAERTTLRRAYPRVKLRSIAVYAPSEPPSASSGCNASRIQDLQRLTPGPVQPALRTFPGSACDDPKTAIAAARHALRGQAPGDR